MIHNVLLMEAILGVVDLTTLKKSPGEVIERAQREAVHVERYGKPAAVIISQEAYERFEKLEDAFWAQVIDARRMEGGHLDNDESLAAIKAMLVR